MTRENEKNNFEEIKEDQYSNKQNYIFIPHDRRPGLNVCNINEKHLGHRLSLNVFFSHQFECTYVKYDVNCCHDNGIIQWAWYEVQTVY